MILEKKYSWLQKSLKIHNWAQAIRSLTQTIRDRSFSFTTEYMRKILISHKQKKCFGKWVLIILS